jgi:hypothetical protein
MHVKRRSFSDALPEPRYHIPFSLLSHVRCNMNFSSLSPPLLFFVPRSAYSRALSFIFVLTLDISLLPSYAQDTNLRRISFAFGIGGNDDSRRNARGPFFPPYVPSSIALHFSLALSLLPPPSPTPRQPCHCSPRGRYCNEGHELAFISLPSPVIALLPFAPRTRESLEHLPWGRSNKNKKEINK